MSALKKAEAINMQSDQKAAKLSKVKTIKNRRRHFRMDIQAGFGFKILTPEQAEVLPLPREKDVYEIMEYFGTDLCKMNEEFLKLLTQIKIKSRPLGVMFEILNNKMNMILGTLDQKDIGLVLPQRKLNLSGNGLGFATARQAKLGDVVDIMIKLGREDGLILARARVVRVLEREPNFLGLHFEDIIEQDRRRIISFLFDKQVEAVH